jgi:hypothetical protein
LLDLQHFARCITDVAVVVAQPHKLAALLKRFDLCQRALDAAAGDLRALERGALKLLRV